MLMLVSVPQAGRDALTFADSATINIDLGSRKVRSGDLTVSCPVAKPKNLSTLKFVDPTGRNAFAATDEGLKVCRGFAVFVR